jgi:hypothetical protein
MQSFQSTGVGQRTQAAEATLSRCIQNKTGVKVIPLLILLPLAAMPSSIQVLRPMQVRSGPIKSAAGSE